MSEQSWTELLGHMHAYADSIEQDIAHINALKEDETLTEAEADEILARLAADHDLITETIAQFRRGR